MGSGHRSPQSNEKAYVGAHLRRHWESSLWLKSEPGSRSRMQWHHCICCTIVHCFMKLNACAIQHGMLFHSCDKEVWFHRGLHTLSCALLFSIKVLLPCLWVYIHFHYVTCTFGDCLLCTCNKASSLLG
jgi:hypothetical protein